MLLNVYLVWNYSSFHRIITHKSWMRDIWFEYPIFIRRSVYPFLRLQYGELTKNNRNWQSPKWSEYPIYKRIFAININNILVFFYILGDINYLRGFQVTLIGNTGLTFGITYCAVIDLTNGTPNMSTTLWKQVRWFFYELFNLFYILNTYINVHVKGGNQQSHIQ